MLPVSETSPAIIGKIAMPYVKVTTIFHSCLRKMTLRFQGFGSSSDRPTCIYRLKTFGTAYYFLWHDNVDALLDFDMTIKDNRMNTRQNKNERKYLPRLAEIEKHSLFLTTKF